MTAALELLSISRALMQPGLALRLMHAAARAQPHAAPAADVHQPPAWGRLRARMQAVRRTVRTAGAHVPPATPMPAQAVSGSVQGATASPAAAARSVGSPEAAVPAAGPVLLVDGHALAFRSYFGLTARPEGGFSARATGTPTSVTQGTLKKLQVAIRLIRPRAVVVAFDAGTPFRRELLARLEQLCASADSVAEAGAAAGTRPPTEEEFVELCKNLRGQLETGSLPLTPASLCNAIQELLPVTARALLDVPAPEHTYKAGRQKVLGDFKQDLHNLRCVLGCLRVPCVSPPHMEADDTLAALTEQAVKQGHPVSILTLDKDLLQLVDDTKRVSVVLVTRAPKDLTVGTSVYKEMREADVLRQEGYLPSRMPDYRSFVGDPSDNLKGVKGIGKVTARELITEHGSLKAVFAALAAGKITNKIALRALRVPGSLKQAHMSLLVSKLRGIHVDLPPTADLFKSKGFLREEVEPLLQRLEMVELHKALPELQEALGGQASGPLSAQELEAVHNLIEGREGLSDT